MNQQPKRKRVLIGPASKAMLIGIIAFGAYSFATKPSPSERRYFEADASGRPVQVERPSVSRPALPRLWKPEPGFLLSHRREIGLRVKQIQRIGEIEAAWALAKAKLERQLEAAARPTEQARSVAAIQSELSDYSALSRDFGSERERAWSSAVALLDRKQQETLTRLSKNTEELR